MTLLNNYYNVLKQKDMNHRQVAAAMLPDTYNAPKVFFHMVKNTEINIAEINQLCSILQCKRADLLA